MAPVGRLLLLLVAVVDLIFQSRSEAGEERASDHVTLAGSLEEEMKCVCDGGCESVLEEDCPWGLTLDVCRCCFLCARGQGEPCGGVHGTCASGLTCSWDHQPTQHADPTKAGSCQRHRRRGRRK